MTYRRCERGFEPDLDLERDRDLILLMTLHLLQADFELERERDRDRDLERMRRGFDAEEPERDLLRLRFGELFRGILFTKAR